MKVKGENLTRIIIQVLEIIKNEEAKGQTSVYRTVYCIVLSDSVYRKAALTQSIARW